MDYTTYVRILDSIEKKAPLESGVQALIYMLVLEQIKDKDLDVVIIDNMKKHSIFMSYGGISDIAIVDNEFNYNSSDRKNIKMCIEVKATNVNIDNNKQVKQQLLTYKKAIITNGRKWIFYKLDNSFEDIDKEINDVKKINDVIEQERKLANAKGQLKVLVNKRTRLVKKNMDSKEVNMEIECKEEDITYLNKKVCEARAVIDENVSIYFESIKIDDENSFRSLCEKLNKFIV